MKSTNKKLVTASLLAGGTATTIYLLNKIIADSAIAKNILYSTENDYYKWRYGDIYYSQTGNGNPVLLIHDLTPSSSSYEWVKIVDDLSKSHTVYTIDLLGCGRSEKPAMTYTNFLYVQMITDFIKEVIKSPTDIIATGLSTSFVITACNSYNDLFKKIMLINPEDPSVLNQIPGKCSKLRKNLLELPLMGTMLYHTINSRANIELQFTESWLYNPFHITNYDVDAYYEGSHRKKGNGKYLLSSISGNYVYLNISYALKNINNSLYIIGGDKQKYIRETIEMYRSINSSIESVILPKTAHLPQLETPGELMKQIKIFME